MNLSIGDAGGAVLVVSQFTLCGDVRKGRRPSFDECRAAADARMLYDDVVRALRDAGLARRDRRVPGDDAGRPRQRRARDDSPRQPADVLIAMRRAFFLPVLVVAAWLQTGALARAQQRPLTTEDPEVIGDGRLLVEAGVETGSNAGIRCPAPTAIGSRFRSVSVWGLAAMPSCSSTQATTGSASTAGKMRRWRFACRPTSRVRQTSST